MRHSYSRLLCLPLWRLWRRLLLVTVCAAGNTSTTLADVGDIDPTYGNNGIFQFPLSATGDCLLRRFSAPVAQAGLLGDGSIVYSTASGGGTTQYGHTDVNGRPNLAYGFAGNRVLQTGFEMCSANGITGPALRTADGKLWLGGSFIGSAGRQSAIMRLDSSGNPDTSFGAGGMVTRPAGSFEVNSKSGDGNWVYRFALQPDGRVLALLAGSSSSITSATDIVVGLRRYNTDGSADNGFGTGGGNAVLPVYSSLPYFNVMLGGSIYLGWDYGDIELLLGANGVAAIVPTLNGSQYWWLVAILPGGDLLYASNDGARSQIARLHADGTPVVSFGGLGTGYTPVVGDSSGTTLSIISVSSAAASSNGRYILVAGSARIGSTASNVVNVVARLDSTTGALDPLFGDRGIVVLGRSLGVTDMVEQPDGSVVLLSGATAIRLQASAAPSPGLISIASTSAFETAGTMTVRVSRTAGNAGAVSVSYATGDTAAVLYPGSSCCVSATAGRDYTAVTGQLDWADGDTADKLITIPVMNDVASPSSKAFEVNLGTVRGSPVIGPKATATIQSITTFATSSTANPTTQSASGGGGFDVLALGVLLLCSLLRFAQWRCLLFVAVARNTSIRCVIASLTTLLLIPGLLRAGVGDIDVSYGDGGFVATSGQVGALRDGSLIYSVGSTASGSIDYAHIDINGHPDTLFGIAGRLTVPADDVGNPARTLRTPGGQLLLSVRKSGNFGLLRLDATGRLDPSFGTAGIATMGGAPAACASETFDGLAMLPDGRVMTLLSTHGPSYLSDVLVSIAVVQLTSHGVVDQRFANGTGLFALATYAKHLHWHRWQAYLCGSWS